MALREMTVWHWSRVVAGSRIARMKSYVVEFVVLEPRGSAVAVRQLLTKRLPWTRDLAVAESGGALKVRVRTGRPELAVVTGVECGTLRDIVVESDVLTRGAA
jgi:dihydroxyacetone kinase-like predicted kinase